MKITIIVDDSAVYVDGYVFSDIDMSEVPKNIHALQFNNGEGWIEFKDSTPNERISVLPEWAVKAKEEFSIKYAENEQAIKRQEARQEAEAQVSVQPVSEEVLLETAKYEQMSLLSVARDIAINKGVEFLGVFYDSNETSRANMLLKLLVTTDGDAISWRAKNDSIIQLTYSQFKSLIKVIDLYVQEQYEKSWEYKNSVQQATTIEEVRNILWI